MNWRTRERARATASRAAKKADDPAGGGRRDSDVRNSNAPARRTQKRPLRGYAPAMGQTRKKVLIWARLLMPRPLPRSAALSSNAASTTRNRAEAARYPGGRQVVPTLCSGTVFHRNGVAIPQGLPRLRHSGDESAAPGWSISHSRSCPHGRQPRPRFATVR